MYRVNDGALVQLNFVGAEKIPVVIVDDFLLDADDIKKSAEPLTFDIDKMTYYPGLRYPVDGVYGISLVRATSQILKAAFNLDLDVIGSVENYFSMVVLAPDQLSPYQKIPHYDFALKKGVAAIHYLCNEEHGGTSFYRHRATGFEFIDHQRFQSYDAILSRELQSSDTRVGYILDSTDQFEKIGTVQAKYNRLVMYPGCVLHSGDIKKQYALDPSTKTGRLTVTSFIHVKQDLTR